MARLVALYGSPRREGNTAALLGQAVAGAREAGAEVREVVLRDMGLSPCLEIYGCAKTGRCVIKDDFNALAEDILAADGLMLASPVMFYTVSAHTKIFMDRCQSLWVKKYWIDKVPFGQGEIRRRGLFVSAGATTGKKLFDGMLLSVRYLYDVFDMDLWRALCYRGLDAADDVAAHPEYLEECRRAGRDMVAAVGEVSAG